MRMILLFASAMILASCTTANMNAGNTGANQQADNSRPDDPEVPLIFRKPPPQTGKWGGYGYGSRE